MVVESNTIEIHGNADINIYVYIRNQEFSMNPLDPSDLQFV